MEYQCSISALNRYGKMCFPSLRKHCRGRGHGGLQAPHGGGGRGLGRSSLMRSPVCMPRRGFTTGERIPISRDTAGSRGREHRERPRLPADIGAGVFAVGVR